MNIYNLGVKRYGERAWERIAVKWYYLNLPRGWVPNQFQWNLYNTFGSEKWRTVFIENIERFFSFKCKKIIFFHFIEELKTCRKRVNRTLLYLKESWIFWAEWRKNALKSLISSYRNLAQKIQLFSRYSRIRLTRFLDVFSCSSMKWKKFIFLHLKLKKTFNIINKNSLKQPELSDHLNSAILKFTVSNGKKIF